jgi:peptidoglycan/LPS O-acetylase OafA/YrhL
MTTQAARVVAFDGLRGMCALGVAFYHYLLWTNVVALHSIGTFGVYILFVLSAASMVIAYAARLGRGVSATQFLLARFARLAPLYIAVAGYRSLFDSAPLGRTVESLLLNASMLFGFSVPGAVPVVTGGWSIGVEVVFYVAFPLLLDVSRTMRGRVALCAFLFAAQLLHVSFSLRGASSLADAWSSYTNPLAYGWYFSAGIAIGWSVVESQYHWARQPTAWAFVLLLSAAVIGGSGPTALETVGGGRGAVLACVAAALVLVTARLKLTPPGERIATAIGQWSYGLYLLHPLVFSVLSSRHLLAGFKEVSPVWFCVASIVVSVAVSAAVWSFFERPLTERLKKALV